MTNPFNWRTGAPSIFTATVQARREHARRYDRNPRMPDIVLPGSSKALPPTFQKKAK